MAALSLSALFPVWLAPTLIGVGALAVALRASAQFTFQLEALGDHWTLSPGFLSLVSALGANIPNYVASLAAFASGQGMVGLGIIVGSNIYNLAVILGLVVLVRPGRRGIAFTLPSMRDVRQVAVLAAVMSLTTLLTFFALPSGSPQTPRDRPAAFVVVQVMSVMTLGVFVALIVHALRRAPHARASANIVNQTSQNYHAHQRPSHSLAGTLARVVVALAVALLAVVIMVTAAQTAAAEMHLPPVILSVVVLAVATSLPNTTVAYELARTERASTSVEEILSSNAINIALGSALPLLIWSSGVLVSPVLRLDMALQCVLAVVVLAQVHVRRMPRHVGATLLGLYVLWVLIHIVT